MSKQQWSMQKEYDGWLINRVQRWISEFKQDETYSYTDLLNYLHSRTFKWTIDMDGNRAADGLDFRMHFTDEHDYTYRDVYLYLCKSCSVLEMMVALACRCDEQLVGNDDGIPEPGRWLCVMMDSLGVSRYEDGSYDEKAVEDIIDRFIDRRYCYDGDGGLFKLRKPWSDMREVEIWYQLAWYLNEIRN